MGGVTDFLLEGHPPDSVALRFEAGDCTRADLLVAVERVGARLMSLGTRAGDRVLLIGDNSLFWVASYLGTLRAGRVSVPLPATTATADLEHVLATTGASVALVESRVAARLGAALAAVRVVTDDALGLSGVAPVAADDTGDATTGALPEIGPDDLAALMFTSGSTARPRGVMISHRNIIANTMSIVDSLRLTARDSVMAVLPFHYCFGTSLLHTHLRVGGSLVLDARLMYVEAFLDRLAGSACTGFAGTPSHFQILLRSSGLRQSRLPHLRWVQQAGGHLPPAQIERLRAALPDTRVFVMYGQTEATARLSCLPPERLDDKPGSIGQGIPGVRLRVVNAAGDDVAPGEVGEITAQGDNVARGYWGDPGESASVFRDGRLHTGDLATVDADGFIYVVGRDRDFLKCRGERVGCQTIEAVLLELDLLAEAAVVGVPDDILGEAVRAFVVPRSAREHDIADRVLAFSRRRLPAHLVPREVLVVPSLPRNSAGKVVKRELRAP